jgi:hypothetical protein
MREAVTTICRVWRGVNSPPEIDYQHDRSSGGVDCVEGLAHWQTPRQPTLRPLDDGQRRVPGSIEDGGGERGGEEEVVVETQDVRSTALL